MGAIARAIVAWTIAGSPALACSGNEIFADDFSDVQISKDIWNLPDRATVSQGHMELKGPPRRLLIVPLPVRLNEFELCADIISPDARQPNDAMAGFVFWHKDGNNFSLIVLWPTGGLAPVRSTDTGFVPLAANRVYDAIKKGARAKNSLRLAVKGNVGTVYVNDQRLVSFRGDPTGSAGWISLFTQSEPDRENAWRFSNVKLADPP